jgi:uncharacterized membrane protein required for colicin V production
MSRLSSRFLTTRQAELHYYDVQGICMAYTTGSGLDNWVYCTLYIHTTRDYRKYSAISILHTFQFTVIYALEFSVFINRILATVLSQSHCHFNSHMKSSCHGLILSLPFFSAAFGCQLQNSTPFSWLLFYIPSRLLTMLSYTSSARTPRKTPSSIVK